MPAVAVVFVSEVVAKSRVGVEVGDELAVRSASVGVVVGVLAGVVAAVVVSVGKTVMLGFPQQSVVVMSLSLTMGHWPVTVLYTLQ